jgi:hypothetical protein
VKRAAVAVSMLFGMAPAAAHALDWSLDTTQSETTELSSNRTLSTPQAPSTGSTSTMTATAEARTPTSKFDFNGDGTYSKYWGLGADGTDQEFLNYGFRAHYEMTEKTNFDREFIETSWRQQSTALALLNAIGVNVPTSGFIDTLSATGGIDRSLTKLDTLSLFMTSTQTSYEPSSGGQPFTDTLTNSSWRHRFSSIATFTASSEVERLDYSNSFNTVATIFRDKIGFDATLSPLLSFRGSAGPGVVYTDRGVQTSGLVNLPVSTTTIDWIADAVVTYRMLKDTTLTLSGSQSIGPTIVGSLFKTDMVTLDLTKTINNDSTLSFSANASEQISTTSTPYASASMTYNYTLTREWSAQMSYRYLHRFQSTGTTTVDPITGTPTVSGLGPADSHALTFMLSHKFTLLPHGT